ncbi:hypothetical protein WISP_47812 [Willisornis vidua]|uniref:Uncharacterized protein n=1 Tax=Willisornis vidua TaxID=1566151 RepID=A0ABQ9DKJ9_9PASS|nr:hypothetical protein WISP_47812 [Willisornis vidua]
MVVVAAAEEEEVLRWWRCWRCWSEPAGEGTHRQCPMPEKGSAEILRLLLHGTNSPLQRIQNRTSTLPFPRDVLAKRQNSRFSG